MLQVSAPPAVGMTFTADLGIGVPMIRDEDDFPGIVTLDLERLLLTGRIGVGATKFGVEAEVALQPDGDDPPLTGLAAFDFTAPKTFGGTLALTGRWTEPFGLRNFGIQNPAFTVAATITEALGIPVPTRLGWNLDVFWKKSGEWPVALPPLVNVAPANVLAVGSTFVYDTEITESGLCLLGICLPLPTFAVRMNLENLSSTDLIRFVNDMLTGCAASWATPCPRSTWRTSPPIRSP